MLSDLVPLTFSTSDFLPGCAFPSVHAVGSLASKVPSMMVQKKRPNPEKNAYSFSICSRFQGVVSALEKKEVYISTWKYYLQQNVEWVSVKCKSAADTSSSHAVLRNNDYPSFCVANVMKIGKGLGIHYCSVSRGLWYITACLWKPYLEIHLVRLTSVRKVRQLPGVFSRLWICPINWLPLILCHQYIQEQTHNLMLLFCFRPGGITPMPCHGAIWERWKYVLLGWGEHAMLHEQDL